MKKTILITTLILALTAQPVFAEDGPMKAPIEEPAEEASAKEISSKDMPTEPMSYASGSDFEAKPGAIAGSMAPFLSESFQTDLATGAATLTIPITVPPGRKNMQPNLALFYSSNNSNGVCGVGWAVTDNFIQRSTKKGAPKYDDSDTFIFISSGSNAELINIGNNEYRPKIESGFMKYVFDTPNNSWTVYDKTGTKYTFGSSGASRLEDSGNIFSWHLNRVEDVYGNNITYIYEKPTDGQIYLKEINYTGSANLSPDKKIIFDYMDDRSDKLYSYRSGWQIATTRRLSYIEVYLNSNIVWAYQLAYATSPDTGRSLLESITVYDKEGNSLPPKTFTYQELE